MATPQPRRNAGRTYKGWKLSFSSTRPITGQWRAERFGVCMCASTRGALVNMIDTRPA